MQVKPVIMGIVNQPNVTITVFPDENDCVDLAPYVPGQVTFQKGVFNLARRRYAEDGAEGVRYAYLG